MKKKPKKILSAFSLAMMAVAAIVSLRNLPLTAEYGFASIFFYIVAGLFFLIPTALVAAELATTWPETGGLYAWVSEAFGHRFGFLATWLEWVMNIVWNPTALSFLAATFAYLINPSLVNDRLFMVMVMLLVFWGATLVNLLGMKASSLVSSIGVILGTLIPGFFIIVLAIIWVIKGNPSQITFSMSNLIPDLKLDNFVFFAGVLLGLAGMEVAAFHASEVRRPDVDYPKSIFYATLLILVIFIFGTLSIAIVVPAKKISLVAGMMQAVDDFLNPFHLRWLTKIFGVSVIIGALAMLSTWIVGPSHGLLASAQHGDLPPRMSKMNKKGMPSFILFAQAIVTTLFCLVFFLMPNINASYWILTALTAQLTTLIYILMFGAAICLRYTQPMKKRPYKIPGGKVGMWIVSGFGILASLFALFVGFIPPVQFKTGNLFFYETFLILGIIILSLPPFILPYVKGKWKNQKG
jgi:putative glutamate/gamma-aminobutyrate antiporter